MNKNDNTDIDEKKLDKKEVLSSYSFDYDIEEEVKEFLMEITYKIHSTTHKFYTELGQMLSEAQEKLSNNKTGVFLKWAESLGIKKDNAYRYINRYKYIVAIRDNITVAKVESLPFSLSSEIAKENKLSFKMAMITADIDKKVIILTGINKFAIFGVILDTRAHTTPHTGMRLRIHTVMSGTNLREIH